MKCVFTEFYDFCKIWKRLEIAYTYLLVLTNLINKFPIIRTLRNVIYSINLSFIGPTIYVNLNFSLGIQLPNKEKGTNYAIQVSAIIKCI